MEQSHGHSVLHSHVPGPAICSYDSLQKGTNSSTNRAQQPHFQVPTDPHTLCLHQTAQLLFMVLPRTADLQVAGVGMDRAAIHAAVVGATTTRPCPTRIPPCNMQRGQVPGQNTLTLGATGSYRRAPADRAVASRPDGGPTGRRRENKATRIERRS